MSGLWRYLFQENPMQIETLRAVRRFTVATGRTAAIQRNITRWLIGLLAGVYVWLLLAIVAYHEDVSIEILWFEFVLLTLLVPGSLYAAISGERERLTWDSLILTQLSPSRILAGKLLWRLGMAGGIMLLFLPPLILTHFVTRFEAAYTFGNLLWVQLCLAAWCVLLAAFTLWVSAKTKRSVVTLSVVTVALLAGLVMVPCLVLLFSGSGDNFSVMALLGFLVVHLNPGYFIGALETHTIRDYSGDFWRGIFTFLPLIYLGLAALCLNRTLKALARLGLPSGAR